MNPSATPGPVAQALGTITYEFYKMKPLLPTYAHLLVSAVFPIFTAAHASLARPPSAAPVKRKPGAKRSEDDEEEEEELSPKLETLTVSDAVLFPILAGVTLGGLYLIIKWLEDPALLNKILGYYFSWMGLFFSYRFLKDIFTFIRSIAFPTQYSAGDLLWQASTSSTDRFIANKPHGETLNRLSPLPGKLLGAIPLPRHISSMLWKLRYILYYRINLKLRTSSPLPRSEIKARLTPAIEIPAFLSAFGLLLYQLFNQSSKPWYLTNFSGFSFCHGSLQFLTPGSSGVGTLLLALLFCYDIYMVFFTPMMVTVATKLDVPIKLLFPRPDGCIYPTGAPEGSAAMEEYLKCLAKKRTMAMLGLGDIVIPGMMVAYALRFDLYKYYLSLQQSMPVSKTKDEKHSKPVYAPARGSWGERFWTSKKHLFKDPQCSSLRAKAFPKTYFYATVAGYLVGMMVTMLVMQVFQHAQPALLYLVPGVLASLWGTALVKGDVKSLWQYDENGEEESEKKQTKDNNNDDSETKPMTDEKQKEAADANTITDSELNGGENAKQERVKDTSDEDKKHTEGGVSDTKYQNRIHSNFQSLSDFSISFGSFFSCSVKPLKTSTSSSGSKRSSFESLPYEANKQIGSITTHRDPQNSKLDASTSWSSEFISKEEAFEAEQTGISSSSTTRVQLERDSKRRRKA